MATQYAIPEELNQMWEGSRDWLADLFQKGLDPDKNTQPPLIPGFEAERPKGAAEQMSNFLMPETPKSAIESGVVGMGPMPAFTKKELIDSINKTLGPKAEGVFESYMINPNRDQKIYTGLRGIANDFKSGQIEDSLSTMLDRFNPKAYRDISIKNPSGGGFMNMGIKKYPDTGFVTEQRLGISPGAIMNSIIKNGYAENLIPFGVGHEIGHANFRVPNLDMYKAGIIQPKNQYIVYGDKLKPVVNPNRFYQTERNLKETNLGDIFKALEGKGRSRVDYWNVGPPDRLPFEEYFADAVGARGIGSQEANKFPIDWSYFEGLFK